MIASLKSIDLSKYKLMELTLLILMIKIIDFRFQNPET